MTTVPPLDILLDVDMSPNWSAPGVRVPPSKLGLQAYSELLRRRGGLVAVLRKKTPSETDVPQKLTKLLLNVNIQRSFGPVQVVMSQENTVKDLIKAATENYAKDKRRPFLLETDPQAYELHYSQYCFESLKPEEKLINLGSRNFFLCPKPSNAVNSSCSGEAKKADTCTFPLTKFMDFLL